MTVLIDLHSLLCADALHRSRLAPGSARLRRAPLHVHSVACAWHSSDALHRPALSCRSHKQTASPMAAVDYLDSRCRGALWDRALARDDSVFAI